MFLMCFFFHCHQITQSSSPELPAFRMFRQGTEELPELQTALDAWNVQMPKDLMSETRREALEAPQDLFVSTGSWGDGGDDGGGCSMIVSAWNLMNIV